MSNPARLKVGYVTKMFPRLSETFVLNEIIELERQGVEVTVFSALKPNEGRFHPQLARLEAQVHYLEDLDPRKWSAWMGPAWPRSPRGRAQLWSLIQQEVAGPDPRGADLVWWGAWIAARAEALGLDRLHAHFATLPSTLAYFAHRVGGLPFSFTAHAKDIYVYSPEETLLRDKAAAAQFVVTVTEFNCRHLASVLGADLEDRVRLVCNGIDLETFVPGDDARRDPGLILGVGRLVNKKGFDLLIDACGLLRDRGVAFRCLIAGEGPEAEALEARVAACGLGDRVVLAGAKTSDEVRTLMQRAQVFCLPCRVAPDQNVDALPTVLLEAMASGLPVVSTRLSGIPEIVDHGVNGVLVEPEDATALADAMEELLASDTRRAEFARTGREKATARFDIRQNVARLNALFRGDADAPRLPGRAGAPASAREAGRLLYVCADPGIPFGGSKGASVHVRQFLDALPGIGLMPTLVVARRAATTPAVAYPVHVARDSRVPPMARALGTAAKDLEAPLEFAANEAMFDALQAVGGESFDLVYERCSLFGVAGLAAARRAGLPFVLEVNAPLVEEAARYRGLSDPSLARRVERLLYTGADHVIAVSEEIRDHVRSIAPETPVTVVPNAVDPSRFQRGDAGWRDRLAADGEALVGFLGRVRPWHGVDRLMDAMALAISSGPAARLCIVGNATGAEHEIRARAAELGLQDRVLLVGEVPFEQVPHVLDAMDVLVAPYPENDAFYFSPLKLFEYMAAGKPIVASRIGQVGRLLRDGETALLVSPGDTAALGGALRRLLSDLELRTALGASARRAVETGHTWSHRMAQLENVFAEVREAGRAAGPRR